MDPLAVCLILLANIKWSSGLTALEREKGGPDTRPPFLLDHQAKSPRIRTSPVPAVLCPAVFTIRLCDWEQKEDFATTF